MGPTCPRRQYRRPRPRIWGEIANPVLPRAQRGLVKAPRVVGGADPLLLGLLTWPAIPGKACRPAGPKHNALHAPARDKGTCDPNSVEPDSVPGHGRKASESRITGVETHGPPNTSYPRGGTQERSHVTRITGCPVGFDPGGAASEAIGNGSRLVEYFPPSVNSAVFRNSGTAALLSLCRIPGPGQPWHSLASAYDA